jgi:DNA-binding transcriptional MerR regulator
LHWILDGIDIDAMVRHQDFCNRQKIVALRRDRRWGQGQRRLCAPPGVMGGRVKKMAGSAIPTIRYYEQVGLLPEGSRSKGNQRRYEHGAIHRLFFIRCARALGIDAIRDLFRLTDVSYAHSSEALRIAKEQLIVVEEKIAQLELLEKLMPPRVSCSNSQHLCPLVTRVQTIKAIP